MLTQEIRGWFAGSAGKAEDCDEGTNLTLLQT